MRKIRTLIKLQEKHLLSGFFAIVILFVIVTSITIYHTRNNSQIVFAELQSYEQQRDLLHHIWHDNRKRQIIFRDILLNAQDPFVQDKLWRDADGLATNVYLNSNKLEKTLNKVREKQQFKKVRNIMREAYLEKNQIVDTMVYQGKPLDLSAQLSSLIGDQDSIFVQIEILENLLQQNHKTRLSEIGDANTKRILLITVITILVILISITLSMAIVARQKSQDRLIDRHIGEINNLNRTLEKRVQQRTNELVLAKEEAERSSQVKTEFLSNMSHELRTPLNAIYGSAQILQNLTKDFNEDDKEWVHHILDSSRHLRNLINDVLDISKITAGKLAIEKTQVSVEDSLVVSLESIRPLLLDKKITLTRATSCSYHVVADPLRLKQVLINLLTNAIKYNQIGGIIDLSCSELDNGFIRISVKDSGEGIKEDDLPRVFDMFERLGKEGSASLGSGVGLALCMKLVQMMGGDIGVRSQKDQGSTFWIDLPQA